MTDLKLKSGKIDIGLNDAINVLSDGLYFGADILIEYEFFFRFDEKTVFFVLISLVDDNKSLVCDAFNAEYDFGVIKCIAGRLLNDPREILFIQ